MSYSRRLDRLQAREGCPECLGSPPRVIVRELSDELGDDRELDPLDDARCPVCGRELVLRVVIVRDESGLVAI